MEHKIESADESSAANSIPAPTPTTGTEWFYAVRGDISQRARTDLRSLRKVIKRKHLKAGDFVWGPDTEERWVQVATVGKLDRALQFANRRNPKPLLFTVLAVAIAGYVMRAGERAAEFLIKPPPPPTPVHIIPFNAASNHLEKLLRRNDFSNADSLLNDCMYSLSNGQQGIQVLSNRIARARMQVRIKRSTQEKNTHEAWTLLAELSEMRESPDVLDELAEGIQSVERRMSALAGFDAAITNPNPKQEEIAKAFKAASRWLSPEAAAQKARVRLQQAPPESGTTEALAAAFLFATYGWTNELHRSLSSFEESFSPRTPLAHTVKALQLLATYGPKEEHEALLKKSLSERPDAPEILIEWAVFLLKEEPRQAVNMLEDAVEAGNGRAKQLIRADTRLTPLHERRDYRRLMM